MAGKGNPKGIKRIPGSGRKKGTPNKRSVKAMEILQGKKFCPIEKLIMVFETAMKNFDEDGSDFRFKYLEIAGNQVKELAQYAYPKRKAIDLVDDNEVGKTLIDIVRKVANKK